MRTILTGIGIFILWSIFSNYWYVCQIKMLCGNSEENQIAVALADTAAILEDDISGDEEIAETEVEKNGEMPIREEFVEQATIYFAFDSSLVLNEDLFQEVTNIIEESGYQNIVLHGHTCNIGPDNYNYDLGKRRADRVKQKLVSLGVKNNWINTVSHGEEQPAVPNISEENREKNRRVEINIK